MARFHKHGQRITVKPKEERTYNGVVYASRDEGLRAEELDWLVKAGTVRFWIGQPLFHLGCPENRYRPDSLVVPCSGNVWVEDIKGFETQSFKRQKMLWKKYGPCSLLIMKRRGNGWKTEEVEGGAKS